MIIPAISLWDPWASLMALGKKKVETRPWGTNYRGPLAIASTKVFTMEHRQYAWMWEQHLRELGGDPVRAMREARGCVLAIIDLAMVVKTELIRGRLESLEVMFGDYTPTRFAWVTDKVHRLAQPIPARGGQRIWKWEVPAGLDLPDWCRTEAA